jgi:uncharacterized membrane protein YfcA
MGFELTVWQWVGAVVSALLVGLSKAGFGAGAGLLAVPLMTYVLGPADMLSVMLLVLITGDVFSIIHYPRDHDNRNLAMLIPGLLAGIGLGTLALGWFLSLHDSALWMKRLIGGVCVVFVLVQLARMRRARRAGERARPYRPRYWHGLGLGTCAGLTSTLAAAGGPLLTIFLLPQELPKRVFVGTTIVYFLVGNLVKLVPYTWKGLMTPHNLLLSAILLPAVVAGTFSGLYLHRRFDDRSFRLLIYCLALLLGVYFLAGR